MQGNSTYIHSTVNRTADAQKSAQSDVKVFSLEQNGRDGEVRRAAPREFKPGDVVRHFKRGLLTVREMRLEPAKYLYQIIGEAENTETGERLMVYRALFGENKIYARPMAMFMSEVDKKKYPMVKQRYRFEKYSIA